eukprot:scaffold16189_cov125-Cylindrotheca_fusiformis.AAC.6
MEIEQHAKGSNRLCNLHYGNTIHPKDQWYQCSDAIALQHWKQSDCFCAILRDPRTWRKQMSYLDGKRSDDNNKKL